MLIESRVRRLLRAPVSVLRFAARGLRDRIRPPRAWNGKHHPVLERFEPWEGEVDGRFCHDFLGVRTDPDFRPQYRPDPPGHLRTELPRPYAPYFELVFVLEAVVEAARHGRFTMVELGAGYGHWMVRACAALRQLAPAEARLIGVEMVDQHFRWMGQHFRNNGIDPVAHILVQAAVSDVEGEAVYLPETDLRLDFGQRVVRREARVAERVLEAPDGAAPVHVCSVTLSRLLDGVDHVDLLHVDIQGEELRALGCAVETLNSKVERLIVATHSRRIHRALGKLLLGEGWDPVFDFGCRRRARTAYGDVQFLDGLLAFVNPGRVRS